MACIKPPANISAPEAPAGPTVIDPIQFEFQLTKKGGIRGLHHVTPDKLVMHVQDPDVHQYDVRELALDIKSGNVRAELHIKGPDGKDHAKPGPHTFTNPALSQIQAKAELLSAYNDPNATREGVRTIGVSKSGTTYTIVTDPDTGTIHGWPHTPNLE